MNYFLSLITGSSYSRFSPLARPRSTPSTPQRIVTSPSHWVKVNSCTNEEISVKSPVFWPQSTKSEPASPSRLCSTPVRRSPKETLQLLRSFYFFSCNFMSLFNRQLYGGARRVRLICDDHDSLPLLPIAISCMQGTKSQFNNFLMAFSFKLYIEERLQKIRERNDSTISAADSLLSLNTIDIQSSFEKSESSVFSDATHTDDNLDSEVRYGVINYDQLYCE